MYLVHFFLSSPSPPAFNFSQYQGLFQWIGFSHQIAYWSFNFSISPSNEYSGLISFRIDWFDLLAIQGTLRSLLQHHSWTTSILQHSALFMVQLSNIHTWLLEKSLLWLYGPLLAKWCLLLFNMLSRGLVIPSHGLWFVPLLPRESEPPLSAKDLLRNVDPAEFPASYRVSHVHYKIIDLVSANLLWYFDLSWPQCRTGWLAACMPVVSYSLPSHGL